MPMPNKSSYGKKMPMPNKPSCAGLPVTRDITSTTRSTMCSDLLGVRTDIRAKSMQNGLNTGKHAEYDVHRKGRLHQTANNMHKLISQTSHLSLSKFLSLPTNHLEPPLISPTINQEFNILVNYFCLFEGGDKSDFSKIKPVAEKLAHEDLTVGTGKGSMDRAKWMAFIKNFTNGGGRMDLLSVGVESDNTIIYKGRLTHPDGVVQEYESRAVFKNGKLFHVEPNDPEKYNKFIEIAESSFAGELPVATGQ